MNTEKISNAILKIWDNLQEDEQSETLLESLDGATNDKDVKAGIVAGVARLIEIGKADIAEEVKAATTGFAF